MTQLSDELKGSFWAQQEAQGLTPADIEQGRVTDLGRRLCDFMEVHAPTPEGVVAMPVQQPTEELSQAS